ncbi:MAG: hypothetical protein V7637_5524 [Mycobacteriales bacterium]
MTALVVAGSVLGQPPAYAASAPIVSAGPLNLVEVSDQLNCNVNHTGDDHSEWFQLPQVPAGTPNADNTACGTFLAAGGALFGPANLPAGPATGRTAWTPTSQTAVTGTGTSTDPFTIVTVVAAGATGLRVTQTDSYVIGQESYRTDIAVANNGAGQATATLYRAGDCFLGNNDKGNGVIDPATGAVACTQTNAAGVIRIEQMLPLTAGSRFIEGQFFDDVWVAVHSGLPLPNSCACDPPTATNAIDNGMGLSWDATLPAGASQTFSSLVTFSPVGRTPLTMAKTADAASVTAGGADGYTITVTNPNVSDVTLTSLTDALPPGFTYRAGSTTGAITADPTASGQTLTWPGFAVPAGGSATVHFGVTVTDVPGTYTDDARGSADGFTVAGTGPTAPVTVVRLNRPPVANPAAVSTFDNVPVAITLTGTDPDEDPLTFAVATGPTHGTLSGDPPALTYTPNPGFLGEDSFTFTASDGALTSAPATVSITVEQSNRPPVALGATFSTLNDVPVAITLTGSDPDEDQLAFAVATGPTHGTLSGDPPALTYTPNPGFVGGDSFTFTANDDRLTSDPATIRIIVAQSNRPPTATDATVVTGIGTPVNIPLTGTDPDQNQITFAVATGPAHGTLTGTPPIVTYSPNAGFVGQDSVTFTANDGTLTSDPGRITITVLPGEAAPNHVPAAKAATVSTPVGVAVRVTLTGTDPDGDALRFAVRGGPAHGRLSGTAPAFTYTPAADFTGKDSITFTASDGRASSAPARVAITVTPLPTVTVSPFTASPGEVVGADLAGFSADTDVTVEVPGGVPTTVHTDATGAATAPLIIIGRDTVGLVEITASAGAQTASCDLVLRPDDWVPPFEHDTSRGRYPA